MNLIKEITANETFVVRHPVLRENKPLESCIFAEDNLPSTKHFGMFLENKIVGVASVFLNKNSNFISANQFQIRGMAVLKKHANNGFGSMLLNFCEEYIYNNDGNIIWLNARENAVNFYRKLDYEIVGNSFTIQDIGLHYLMKKEIG